MKALVITEHGPPDVLRVEERPDPEPGPGEVRVRVRAAGVNFADLLGRVGLYSDAPATLRGRLRGSRRRRRAGGGRRGLRGWAARDGRVPLRRLRAAGRGQDRLAGSDAGRLELQRGRRGAGHVLHRVRGAGAHGGLRPGERVLIQAAAGGVGIAATQIAKLLGAEVYGTASPSKHEAIREFGVDHPVDYRTHDVVDVSRKKKRRKYFVQSFLLKSLGFAFTFSRLQRYHVSSGMFTYNNLSPYRQRQCQKLLALHAVNISHTNLVSFCAPGRR